MEHKAYDSMVWSGFAMALLFSLQEDAKTMTTAPATGWAWYALILKYIGFALAAWQTAWARNKVPPQKEG